MTRLAETVSSVAWERLPVDIERGEPSENAAALRQFSAARLCGYGVDAGDVSDLRAIVEDGGAWKAAALELAARVESPARDALVPMSARSRSDALRRASALLRMSQMLMLEDSDERREIYARAVQLFAEATASPVGGIAVEHTVIDTRNGSLAGWFLTPAGFGNRGPAVVIMGGIEGWAMDLFAVGEGIAHRGISVLMLDGPGQGESRFALGRLLGTGWLETMRDVVEHVAARAAGPVGMLGNSMGGAFVPHLARHIPELVAVVNNGGPRVPLSQRERRGFFPKMVAFCDRDVTKLALADEVWSTVEVADEDLDFPAAYLVIHGGKDPLITDDEAITSFERATSPDKSMVVFAEGDHCVNTHHRAKIEVIADWFGRQLVDPERT